MRLGDVLRARSRDSEDTEQAQTGGTPESGGMVVDIPLAIIEANPFQPRSGFDEESMKELAQSLVEHGLIQPVIVRSCPGGYQLVAGERRVRAARYLGWQTIPAVVRELDDVASAQVALIENLQREDLNYWEEAEAYQRLLREFSMTQEDLAEKIGKSQSAIANKLRLLRLSPRVRASISREIMSERHCRALLRLDSEEAQLQVIEAIKERHLSVKDTEELIRQLKDGGTPKQPRQRVIRLWKDARLLQNSVRRLVKEMRAGGAEVELEETQEEDVLELRVRIKQVPNTKRPDGAEQQPESR
ncbi:MAG: ParB/RepB/Spo0J family partition protein [Firmicutes bacterium]|nr:ParB/RepB/Spo0J family partition protein [Bacillota bacterium]